MTEARMHRRALGAFATTLVLTMAPVGLAASAQADPGAGPKQGQGDPAQGKGGKGNHGQGNNGNGGNGNHGQGNNGNGGNGNNGQGHNGNGDPAGNNGTVKVAPLGELDGIPNNTPHPGCTFQIEWYGFDEGDDVVSTVTFAMQAPTKDVELSVDGPDTVFVGGDPATGAGTPTGLDGTQAYTLSFEGEPHPKQGYHVKLTVATPRSQGNDTKTKVFWVAPCADENSTNDTPSSPTGDVESDDGESGDRDANGGEVSAGEGSTGEPEQGVAGTDVAPDGGASSSDVPDSVDAGANNGDRAGVIRAVTSPIGLLVMAAGLLAGIGAFLLRRRSVG